MELRVLRYFLATAQEGSISAAAEYLHLTQPTLSRQLKELEDELGCRFFKRVGRRLQLTEAGYRFQKQAEEIVELVDKTLSEHKEKAFAGDLCIGAGETAAVRIVAAAAAELRKHCPRIRCHLHSGNADEIMAQLEKGLLDFALMIEPVDLSKYECIKLPYQDRWGLLVREDDPLAGRERVCPEDLVATPLLLSRQSKVRQEFLKWFGSTEGEIDIAATYNLPFNAALMVEAGYGRALCLDGLFDTRDVSKLRFIPLDPPMEVGVVICWKKYQVFSRTDEIFLNLLKEEVKKAASRRDGV